MKLAVDSKKMKQIDDYTINEMDIPALLLMERAAMETAYVMKQVIDRKDRILAVCGQGNNGGDGIATGRILSSQGYHVAILFIGDEKKASQETRWQLKIARNLGLTFDNRGKLHEYNIVIDAIFGIGLSRPVTGEYAEIIEEINRSDHTVFSVDIPSGISADTGRVMDTAVEADYTVTFGYQKLGLMLFPGVKYAGRITVADIGFPKAAADKAAADTFYYCREDLMLLPERREYSNKGTYGKVLVIAGSMGMSGAAYLSAKAAYRTGAGMVKILTASDNRIILQTSLPEALFASYDGGGGDNDSLSEEVDRAIGWASVIVIGPGLGKSSVSEKLLSRVMELARVPVIIDADGINILADWLDKERCTDISERVSRLNDLLKNNTILTPHLMELSRLIGVPVMTISDNIIDTARQCSYNNKLIFAIKDARTIVTKDGRQYINVSGNNGMATAGSGDVLTGIIGSLMAQGMEAYTAVCLAAYIHGLAGDEAAKDKGWYSLMAGDIIASIEQVISDENRS